MRRASELWDAVRACAAVESPDEATLSELFPQDCGFADPGFRPMPVQTTDELLAALNVSGLLSQEQLAVLASSGRDTPQALVDYLVGRGWVTGWQADALVKGRRQFNLGGFRLLRELGVGMTGRVYMAREQAAQRIVALKILAADLIDNRESLERFRREARAVGALQHPNIVAAFGAGQVEKTHFLVMEYVPGKSLADWIRQYERLPVAWSCECVRQAALGLQHAFERGVVHRDVKPANLMVACDGLDATPQVKILDMGLARFTRERRDAVEISQTNNSVGTAEYMAPEQALDAKHVDIRADVYALGGTLYRCLTGEVPFAGLSALQAMMRKLEEPAPRLAVKRPDLPAELIEIVDRMLSIRPEDRFATPGEVAAALAPFCLSGENEASVSTVSTPQSLAKTKILSRVGPPRSSVGKTPAPATRGATAASDKTALRPPVGQAKGRGGWKLALVGLIAVAALGAGAYCFWP